jgi:hypothetical protein
MRHWTTLVVLALVVSVAVVQAADTTVSSVAFATTHNVAGLWGPYWIDTLTGLIVFVDSGFDVNVARTTNGGATWTPTEVEDGVHRQMSVWFDQETPTDSGTLVHILWLDSADTAGSQDAKYVNVDISDGAVGTIRTVDGGITVSTTGDANKAAITKAVNGTLVAAFSTQNEIQAYKSTDLFVTPTHIVNDVFESGTQEDFLNLFPANVDAGDVAGIFFDRSANEVSVKMFDDSEGTWSETSIVAAADGGQTYNMMDQAVRHSDRFILGCQWNDYDAATADLVTYTVNPNSIATPPVNTGTAAVVENLAESVQCAMLINQQTNDVYVAYLKGNTLWETDADVVYQASTDDMATWNGETAYSETLDDARRVHAGRTVGDSGGFFQPAWFDVDDADVFVNLVNDVAITAAAPVASTVNRRLLLGVP